MTKRLKVNSPYDGHLIAEINLDGTTRVEKALEIAHQLADKPDKILPAYRRIEILEKTADIVNSKAEELAHRRGVSINTLCCDLAAFHPEPASVDLIAAIWMHVEPDLRARVFQHAIEALRPGGHLLIEAYSPKQLGFSSGGPTRQELLIEAAQLRHELAALEPLILQEIEREITEGSAHQGPSAVVQFFGRKP